MNSANDHPYHHRQHRHENDKTPTRSSSRATRNRPWRHSRTGTVLAAALALLFSSTAWISLVFSASTPPCWHCFNEIREQISNSSLVVHRPARPLIPGLRPPSLSSNPVHESPEKNLAGRTRDELSLTEIVFGIAGSSALWKRRKEYVRMWWRNDGMRGHVWLEEPVVVGDGDDSLPPIMISEDISRFRYTNPTGHPSGLRISRIISESFRLGLPGVRWFVLGDDDTLFNLDNLVAVLSKYDDSEMVYIGKNSESHSANTHFSHSMAFGGGGIAISYPLAEALSNTLDQCLERYPNLYGSDDRLHACITELGIPLTREDGFHQFDIRGNAQGLLSSHPIAPFVSIHHIETVDPFYPGLTTMNSLRLFTRAMRTEPRSFLQRAFCYDHSKHLTISVSLGYMVQVYPNIVLPLELEQSEHTYSAWNKISNKNEFDFDTRAPYKSICKSPVLFFLKDVERKGNITSGFYMRTGGDDDLRRKVFCFPRLPPLQKVQKIHVIGYPLSKNWHLVPRRLCCKVQEATNKLLKLNVRQCDNGALAHL